MADAFHAYEEFFLANKENIGYAETLLQAGFSLTPSRYGNHELNSELVYSGFGLISLLHDVIVMRKQRKEIEHGNLTGKHSLVPKWWERTSIALSSVSVVSVAIEIYAKSRDKDRRWRAVIIVELIKVILRLWLLFRARGAIVVKQSIPARDKTKLMGNEEKQEQPEQLQQHTTRRERETLMDNIAISKSNTRSWRRFWTSEAKAPESEVYIPTIPTQNRTIGEVLYILRPLIYVLAIVKYGRTSWTAWLASAIVDFLSHKLTSSQSETNEVEREELSKRKYLWALYLVRSPCYEKFLCLIVRAMLPSFIKNHKWAGSISNIVEAYRELYYYTAGA